MRSKSLRRKPRQLPNGFATLMRGKSLPRKPSQLPNGFATLMRGKAIVVAALLNQRAEPEKITNVGPDPKL